MKINKCLSLIVCGILMGLLFQGCQQYNVAYTPLVPDSGEQIVTRNKYYISEWTVSFESGERMSFADTYPNCMQQKSSSFASFQPGVFSSAGVPISINENNAQREKLNSRGGFTVIFPFLLSCMTLPFFIENESCCPFEISVNGGAQSMLVKIHGKDAMAFTGYTPIALIVPMDDGFESKPGYRTFHKHGRSVFGDGGMSCYDQALAYGLAVKLKELEDAGQINSVPASVKPLERISKPARENDHPVLPEKSDAADKERKSSIRQKSDIHVYEMENLSLQ